MANANVGSVNEIMIKHDYPALTLGQNPKIYLFLIKVQSSSMNL